LLFPIADEKKEPLVNVEEELFSHIIWQQKDAWLHIYKSLDSGIDYGVQNLLKEMSRYGVDPYVMD
jgi:hypothetical protein